jgi:peptide/nickel transport system permease protein
MTEAGVSDASSVDSAGASRKSAGPWRVALRKLLRDRTAIICSLGLALIVLCCVLAPQYAHWVGVDPFRSGLDATVTINGVEQPVMQPETGGLGIGVTPIGPSWRLGPYMLGADDSGRDVMARMLYGGRNSLFISFWATIVSLVIGSSIGLLAGLLGGMTDAILSRFLDIVWAFPVYLLAISLSIILVGQGISLGPIAIKADSLWLPIMIIGLVYIPYVALPVRGQILALRQSDYVAAVIGIGASTGRILVVDILPNVLSSLIVMAPILMALNMLTESALSFLSIGVQAPDASWGTIIEDGQQMLYTRPAISIAPGIAVSLCILMLDPKSKVKHKA